MNYSSKGSSSWGFPEEGYAPAHNVSVETPAPEGVDAHSIDHILVNLMQEARTLGIPLCGEFITAARQVLAERLAHDAAAAGE